MKWFLRLSYPFFCFIALIVPRDKEVWVFGNQKKYFDNTKYFFEYVSSLGGKCRCVWLANNLEELEEVKAHGYQSVLKKSLYGYWISSRAGFSFICNGFSDVNRALALRSKVVNFWHGTPIKKIYLDSAYDLEKLGKNKYSIMLSRLLLRFINSNIDIYFASNSFESCLVSRAAGLSSDKSIVLGAPRFDYIRSVKRNPKLPAGRIYLYAPTWREAGFTSTAFSVSHYQYSRLDSYLSSNNITLLVKQHPLTDKKQLIEMGLVPSSNILYADDIGIFDINELYKYSDLLVTDVSSSMFDYSLFCRPVVLFMPDSEEYICGERGLYQDFVDLFRSGSVIRDWNGLLDALEMSDFPELGFIGSVRAEIAAHDDVCERIYSEINARYFSC